METKIKASIDWLKRLHWTIWLVLFLASAGTSVYALRHNNLTMIGLRNQLYAADQQGQGVEPALDKLRGYIYSHMNTDPATPSGIYPPIQLVYTYDRLSQANNPNTYHDAQLYCEKNQPNGYYGAYRLDCVRAYIQSHPTKNAPVVPPALYEFDFISPAWSPDLAGWSLVVTVIFGLALVTKLVAGSHRLPKFRS